jgi:putative NIF3 family GTP cyclohydrolase 1 type 2
VGTLLIMHFSERHYSRVKTEYLNVVNAGHMASDTLGLNLVLDKAQKRGDLEILECSGFRRFQRRWA